MEGFTVSVVAWSEAAPLLSGVRRVVFVEEQGVPEALEWDGADDDALHALALDATGAAIGTARLVRVGKEGRLGRMAVIRPWRGRGVGSALLQRLLVEARRCGLAAVLLHAQIQAVAFYQRFGFRPEGSPFLEAGIPHVTMSLPLGSAPE